MNKLNRQKDSECRKKYKGQQFKKQNNKTPYIPSHKNGEPFNLKEHQKKCNQILAGK